MTPSVTSKKLAYASPSPDGKPPISATRAILSGRASAAIQASVLAAEVTDDDDQVPWPGVDGRYDGRVLVGERRVGRRGALTGQGDRHRLMTQRLQRRYDRVPGRPVEPQTGDEEVIHGVAAPFQRARIAKHALAPTVAASTGRSDSGLVRRFS